MPDDSEMFAKAIAEAMRIESMFAKPTEDIILEGELEEHVESTPNFQDAQADALRIDKKYSTTGLAQKITAMKLQTEKKEKELKAKKIEKIEKPVERTTAVAKSAETKMPSIALAPENEDEYLPVVRTDAEQVRVMEEKLRAVLAKEPKSEKEKPAETEKIEERRAEPRLEPRIQIPSGKPKTWLDSINKPIPQESDEQEQQDSAEEERVDISTAEKKRRAMIMELKKELANKAERINAERSVSKAISARPEEKKKRMDEKKKKLAKIREELEGVE